jgi:hypothetical protein
MFLAVAYIIKKDKTCLAKCGDGGACDLAHAVDVLEIECENFDVILDHIAPAGSDDFQFYGK